MMQHVALVILSKKFVYGSALALGIVAMTVDPTIFAAAVVTVITAVSGAAVIIINAVANAKKDLLAQQQVIIAKADVIQGHVDGMTTAAEAKRTADEDTILSLRQQLSDSEGRARMLAQAKTNVDIATAVPSTSPQGQR